MRRIAVGGVDEALAQFEARREPNDAIAALNWDDKPPGKLPYVWTKTLPLEIVAVKMNFIESDQL